jgi:hypothetical protein
MAFSDPRLPPDDQGRRDLQLIDGRGKFYPYKIYGNVNPMRLGKHARTPLYVDAYSVPNDLLLLDAKGEIYPSQVVARKLRPFEGPGTYHSGDLSLIDGDGNYYSFTCFKDYRDFKWKKGEKLPIGIHTNDVPAETVLIDSRGRKYPYTIVSWLEEDGQYQSIEV